MSTYNGRTIVTVPTSLGPRTLEWTQVNLVGSSLNPFTGQQQVQDWNASWMEGTVTLPPISNPTFAADWVSFLLGCKGMASVFALPAAWSEFLPPVTTVGYYSLKNNTPKYSISEAMFYGVQFDIREAV